MSWFIDVNGGSELALGGPEHCSLEAALLAALGSRGPRGSSRRKQRPRMVLAARSPSQESENQLWEEDWSRVIPGEPLENWCLHGHTETWWVRGSEPRAGRVEPEIDFCLRIYGPCITSVFPCGEVRSRFSLLIPSGGHTVDTALHGCSR